MSDHCWDVTRETFACCSCGEPGARLLLLKDLGREARFEGACSGNCPAELAMHSTACGHDNPELNPLERVLAGYRPEPSEHDLNGDGDRPNYLDREGLPLSFPAWAMIVEGAPEYRYIAQDRIGDVLVSTVWLGLDHAWCGPVQIFETMVFGAGDEIDMARYATEAEAIAGHAEKVAEYRAHRGRKRSARRRG